MSFEIIPSQTIEPILMSTKIFKDSRGYFMESYKKSDFEKMGIKEYFQQDNVSFSSKGVLRGLHYQMNPKSQGKLVSCLKGEVLDVLVDIRKGSPNFGRWQSYVLTQDNGNLLYVPPGFAHGFLTLSRNAIFMYKCTAEYSASDERGVVWNDPDIGIEWGIKKPVISLKDKDLPKLKNAENNFIYESSYKKKAN
jgi:dTDP-4-dehydrorhamnose 3,5-epimerase